MTVVSNPRLAVFGLILIALLAAGISVFFLMGPFYGIAATALAALIDWNMFKVLRRQLRTTVTVDEEGVRFNLYGEEKIDLPWPELTLVGLAVEAAVRGRRGRQLYFYKEEGDRLMVVPADFARFEDLVAETRRLAPAFRDLGLAASETLQARLRTLVVPPAAPAAAAPAAPAAAAPAAAPSGPRDEAGQGESADPAATPGRN